MILGEIDDCTEEIIHGSRQYIHGPKFDEWLARNQIGHNIIGGEKRTEIPKPPTLKERSANYGTSS